MVMPQDNNSALKRGTLYLKNVSHLLQYTHVYYQNERFFILDSLDVVIVAFLENATIGYSLESRCVCVCVCVCVCFCTITQKEIDLGTRNRNTL